MGAPLVGVVLAGGLSSRLGHDKALVRLHDGGTADLLSRTAHLLRGLTDDVFVVGRSHPGYACLPDLLPGRGPVGGIATALTHASGSACLVLSCDLPFMTPEVLEHLVKKREGRPAGAHATLYRQRETGHFECLVAVYEPEALPYFRLCMEGNLLKISQVVPKHEQHCIDYPAADSLPFFNINYPADLEAARRIMFALGRE